MRHPEMWGSRKLSLIIMYRCAARLRTISSTLPVSPVFRRFQAQTIIVVTTPLMILTSFATLLTLCATSAAAATAATMPPSSPLLILLDFDGTITQNDTLDALVHSAISFRSISRSRSQSQSQSQCQPQSKSETALTFPEYTGGESRCSHCPEGIIPEEDEGGNQNLGQNQDQDQDVLSLEGTHTQTQTQKQKQNNEEEEEGDKDNDNLLLIRKWNEIVTAYSADYEAHVSGYAPPAEERTELRSELEFLESLRPVEKASLRRVEEAGLFASVGRCGFLRMGREAVGDVRVVLRRGWDLFVSEVCRRSGGGGTGERGWEVGVVSVNWSKGWVEGVLRGGIGGESDGLVVSRWGMRVNTVGGEEGRIYGPEGSKIGVMMTARDKLEAARELVGDGREAWVYVGDSVTDLACLVEATMGIVITQDGERNPSSLLRTLRRVGFEVAHVATSGLDSGLVWARDFEEVVESRILDRVTTRKATYITNRN